MKFTKKDIESMPSNIRKQFEEIDVKTETKYKSIAVTIDGIYFRSTKEGKRYIQLRFKQKMGFISDLKLQVVFELITDGILIEKYIADFTYIENGEYVVEDTKGKKTSDYKRKRKWMKNILGIEIKET